MKKLIFLILGFFLWDSALSQTTFMTARHRGYTVGTSFDTTQIAAPSSAIRARIKIVNDSSTPTDTLFFAFNGKLSDSTATRQVDYLLPGESETISTIGVYYIHLKGKTSGQATRLRVFTNVPW